ncbi:MAG: hypothetical protein ACRERX_23760 [Pseudomonas sp.]
MNDAHSQLSSVIRAFLEGELNEKDFSERFERLYNLEVDRTTLSPEVANLFEDLFNEVVLYSPFEEDRKKYAGYRDERAIRKAALRAWTRLKQPGT